MLYMWCVTVLWLAYLPDEKHLARCLQSSPVRHSSTELTESHTMPSHSLQLPGASSSGSFGSPDAAFGGLHALKTTKLGSSRQADAATGACCWPAYKMHWLFWPFTVLELLCSCTQLSNCISFRLQLIGACQMLFERRPCSLENHKLTSS